MTLESIRLALALSRPEERWLDRLSAQAQDLGDAEDTSIERVRKDVERAEVRLGAYELAAAE